MRELVTNRVISDIVPIKGADYIERVTIDGWHCVARKAEFSIGDHCIYFEIDSFLPESDERFSFIMKSGVREFEGSRGHRLRTVKLRKQISQGMALPVDMFPELVGVSGIDMASIIGIKKWEASVPACIAGEVEGGFPSFIKKTDEERAQNIVDQIFADNIDSLFEVSMKLDGASMTAYACDWFKRTRGVCMRNYELKINDNNSHNTLVKLATNGLLDAIASSKLNVAVQGEVMGEGIQCNREGFKGHSFHVFNIYLIDEKRYMQPKERINFFNIFLKNVPNVFHVPVIHDITGLSGISSIDDLLLLADGESINNKIREGLVWKRLDGKFSFKTISNIFLMK